MKVRHGGSKRWTVGETQELNLGGRKDRGTQVKHIGAGQVIKQVGNQEQHRKRN